MFAVLGLPACSLPFLDLLSATPTPSQTPTVTLTATPTATATPTPTNTPPPLTPSERGERSLFIGDWEGAIDAFQGAIASAPTGEDRAWYELRLGTTFLAAGRYEEALRTLTGFIETYPEHDYNAWGHFQRAGVFQTLGADDLALADFERYLQLRPGVLDSYVHEQMGDGLRRLGNFPAAIHHYEQAMQAPHLGDNTSLLIKLGNSHVQSGEYAAAVTAFDQAFQLAVDDDTSAILNLLSGQALEAMGDFEAAYGRYQDSVERFPEAEATYQGLIRLVNAGVPVDELQRGIVDYYAEAYDPALAAFNRFLAATPTGTGFYFRGLTRAEMGDLLGALEDLQLVIDSYPQDAYWEEAWFEKAHIEWIHLSQPEMAIQTYLVFVGASPSSARAPEALSRGGELAERIGELENAASIWLRIPSEYPQSDRATQGAFKAGIVRYRMGLWGPARDAFLLSDAFTTDVWERSAARLWAGKTYAAEGDDLAAELAWRRAADIDPTGYYSERARELIVGQVPFQPAEPPHFAIAWEEEREAAEGWLRERFEIQGPEPLTELNTVLLEDSRMVRGQEYWRLGLYQEAKSEFESLRRSVGSDPEATYRLMHTFLDLGLYQPAIFASRTILDLAGLDDAGTLGAPRYFNLIRFGTYFSDILFPLAQGEELDLLFVLSVVRQESLFEGFITSYADARGLMQVIPSTGQGIADKLGWPEDYSADDLYRPIISARFGVDYLADQRDLFDGDLYAALAAYNAGPGNALAWKEIAPDDQDLFLEVIRLDQPQRYIRSIFEIHKIYQSIYTQG